MLAKREGLDVLLCPNANAPPISVGCPIVTYVHDVNAQKGMSSGVHQLYRKFVVPPGIRNSDAIVTVSEFSKQEIVEHLPVSAENVHVVYNGVDDFYHKPGGSEPLDLPDQYILYVGAMNPRKNIGCLVAAYDLIREDVPHKLVLIGPQNKSVYKKLDVDSFAEDIVTPGFLPRAQLKSAYENAAVFVYPSLYEGFGLPPLEAMACGTPVIVSDTSSLPEIVGDAALQVDPENPIDIAEMIKRMITDNKLREAFSSNGRSHAGEFRWDRSGEQLIKVLNQSVR
jgi:glycosyltransferase involved in cell wall biosynthesis